MVAGDIRAGRRGPDGRQPLDLVVVEQIVRPARSLAIADGGSQGDSAVEGERPPAT
jgi:hypothetical protein